MHRSVYRASFEPNESARAQIAGPRTNSLLWFLAAVAFVNLLLTLIIFGDFVQTNRSGRALDTQVMLAEPPAAIEVPPSNPPDLDASIL